MRSFSASKYNHFYFVSHCSLSVYSFVCLHLSRAPYFLNSRFIHLTWCSCSLVTEVRIVRQINCETVGAESSIIASKHDNFPFLSLALFTHYVFFCVSSGSSSLSVCSCGPFSSWNYVWLVRKNHCHGITVSCSNRPFYRHGGHIEIIRVKEYYGMPRVHSLSIYARFSGKKRTSLCISREKGDHYYVQTR